MTPSPKSAPLTAAERADRTLIALLDQPQWVIRTVEAVALVDRHTARRRISRHFSLPKEHLRPYLASPHDEVIRLPVFGVTKGQFISCDLIDERRQAVSLPALPDRADFSSDALKHFASKLLNRHDSDVGREIDELVRSGPQSAERLLVAARYSPHLGPLFSSKHFDYLATYLARNYVVFADVTDTGKTPGGRVLRFELYVRFPHTRRELEDLRNKVDHPTRPFLDWKRFDDERFPRFRRGVRFLLRRAGIRSNPYHHAIRVDGAGSLHLEIEETDGVAYGYRRLRFKDRRRLHTYDKTAPGASSRRARFLIPRSRGPGDALMTIAIRPAPGALRNGAPAVLLAMSVLLWFTAAHFTELDGPTAMISVILLIPGLVSLVAAKPDEHPYVTSVVIGIRILAILPIPLGLIAAFVLATYGSADVLCIEAAVAGGASAILLLGRALDARAVKPTLVEHVEDDLTRIG